MTQKTWAERFLSGFTPEDGEPDYRLRSVVAAEPVGNEDKGDHDLFMAGWNTLAHAYHHKALQHLEILVGCVESPIEKAMLFALCVAAQEGASNVRYKVRGRVFGDFEDLPDLLIIEPQAQLGEYRVDFLLSFKDWLPDFESLRHLKNGLEIPGVKEAVGHLIVECDGHDFHDRSKEQASRDRERDRELKKLGFEVFRYTGSDIWKNPMARASEAVEHLTKSVWK